MEGLFVAEKMFVQNSGSKVMEEAYYECLLNVIGKDNLHAVAIKHPNVEDDKRFICLNRKADILTFMKGYTYYLDRRIIKQLDELIEKNHYKFVFFMTQSFGKYEKSIKKKHPQIVTMTYFPGIAKYHFETTKYYHPGLHERIFQLNSIYNEKITTAYSDVRILLNQREDNNLYKYYGVHSTDIIPIFMKDTFPCDYARKDMVMDHKTFNLLFVGVYFPPNVSGLKWFFDNVMDRLSDNIHFYVVGSGMDKLQEEISDNPKIHIKGRVEDLAPYYMEANVIVEPIFNGDGMKTKTAEALMYGKTIVGSKEALYGYDETAGIECNTADEFVKCINELQTAGVKKFNPEKRDMFINNYSIEATCKALRKIFKRYGIGDERN